MTSFLAPERLAEARGVFEAYGACVVADVFTPDDIGNLQAILDATPAESRVGVRDTSMISYDYRKGLASKILAIPAMEGLTEIVNELTGKPNELAWQGLVQQYAKLPSRHAEISHRDGAHWPGQTSATLVMGGDFRAVVGINGAEEPFNATLGGVFFLDLERYQSPAVYDGYFSESEQHAFTIGNATTTLTTVTCTRLGDPTPEETRRLDALA